MRKAGDRVGRFDQEGVLVDLAVALQPLDRDDVAGPEVFRMISEEAEETRTLAKRDALVRR